MINRLDTTDQREPAELRRLLEEADARDAARREAKRIAQAKWRAKKKAAADD